VASSGTLGAKEPGAAEIIGPRTWVSGFAVCVGLGLGVTLPGEFLGAADLIRLGAWPLFTTGFKFFGHACMRAW
jgi:hypothetical protein